MTEPSEIELINKSLDNFLESEIFEAKIVKYTHHACKDILHMVVRPALIVGIALFSVITGLVIYIFVSSNNTIMKLAEETQRLRYTVSAFEERSKNNQDAIKIILEEMQRKRY